MKWQSTYEMATDESSIEQVEMANEVRLDTIFVSINKMTNLVIGHREPKNPRTQKRNLETSSNSSNATLKSDGHRFNRKWEGGRRKRDHQEKLLGATRWREVNRGTKFFPHLIGQGQPRSKVPV